MDWAVFFLAWAAMWVWVVRHRGAWNLIVANALGAASGIGRNPELAAANA